MPRYRINYKYRRRDEATGTWQEGSTLVHSSTRPSNRKIAAHHKIHVAEVELNTSTDKIEFRLLEIIDLPE